MEDVLGVTQDPHSTGFYRKLVRHFPADQVWALISETRQVIAEGRVNTLAGRYFTDLAKRQLQRDSS